MGKPPLNFVLMFITISFLCDAKLDVFVNFCEQFLKKKIHVGFWLSIFCPTAARTIITTTSRVSQHKWYFYGHATDICRVVLLAARPLHRACDQIKEHYWTAASLFGTSSTGGWWTILFDSMECFTLFLCTFFFLSQDVLFYYLLTLCEYWFLRFIWVDLFCNVCYLLFLFKCSMFIVVNLLICSIFNFFLSLFLFLHSCTKKLSGHS